MFVIRKQTVTFSSLTNKQLSLGLCNDHVSHVAIKSIKGNSTKMTVRSMDVA